MPRAHDRYSVSRSLAPWIVFVALAAAWIWFMTPSTISESSRDQTGVAEQASPPHAVTPEVTEEGPGDRVERDLAESLPGATSDTNEEDLTRLEIRVETLRGNQEFTVPEPHTWVEVWTKPEPEQEEEEPQLISSGRTDERGQLRCTIPTDSAFTIVADSNGEVERREITLKHAMQFELIYRGSAGVYFPAHKAKISLEGQFLVDGRHSRNRYNLVASREALPERVLRGQRRFAQEITRRQAERTVKAEVEVVAGHVWYIALYGNDGSRLAMTSTSRALVQGETFEWFVEIDEFAGERDYFFRLEGDEDADFSNGFGPMFQVRLHDGDHGWLVRSPSCQHEVGSVYRIRVPKDHPMIARISTMAIGGVTWEIAPGKGMSESAPEVLRVHPPVRVRVPASLVEEAKEQRMSSAQIGFAQAMPLSTPFRAIEGEDAFEIRGFSTEAESIRIGNRLFRCNLTTGGSYRLGDPELPEHPIPSLTSLTVRVSADFPFEDACMFLVRVDGMVWAHTWIQVFGTKGVRHHIEVPPGPVELTVRYGNSQIMETRLIEVGADDQIVEFSMTRS